MKSVLVMTKSATNVILNSQKAIKYNLGDYLAIVLCIFPGKMMNIKQRWADTLKY